MKNKKYFYITTPLYYASGNPHIGHAYATISADLIARYKREIGKDVFFLTGTDEHGEKIQKNAEKAGLTPEQFVDNMANTFQKLWKDVGVSNDDFIRTTQERHVKVVQEVFSKLLANGDIYKGTYKGWYCTPCEAFYTDQQLDENHCCPECHREVHEESQECYFLNCKKYLPQLLKFYEEHPEFVPNGKLKEMIKTFIEPGLDDLCITRTNFTWGIPVKEDPKHVVYVWIDALLNYISALGFLSEDDSRFNKYWSEDAEILQLAGREINRFHSIYWPILLFALNLRLPDTIFIHGLLVTKAGTKLSKSLGNAPSPYPIIERFGLDSLRYYIGSENSLANDGNFTPKQFVDRINNDLVNNYGNLVNRSINMIHKYFNDELPNITEFKNEHSKELIKIIDENIEKYCEAFDNYEANVAFAAAMTIIDAANKYIEKTTPWIVSKEGNTELLAEILYSLAEAIRVGSILLRPALINKANEALEQLNVDENIRKFDSIHNHNSIKDLKVNKPVALFPRLDSEKEIEFLSDLIQVK